MSPNLGWRNSGTLLYFFAEFLYFETFLDHSIKHEILDKYNTYGLRRVLHRFVSFGRTMVLNSEIDAIAKRGYRVTLVMR